MRSTTRIKECTSLGKVALASPSPEDYERTVEWIEWVSLTPNSISDPETVGRELDEVAQQGRAFYDCEYNPDVCGVAAPVRDRSGAIIMSSAADLWVSLDYVSAPSAFDLARAHG